MTQRAIGCPRCHQASIDTVVSAPYTRGFLLTFTVGTKRMLGCNACVKKQLAGEVATSLLTGWFSLPSLLLNPLYILWNGARVPFVKADPEKVEALLRELGVSTERVDLARVAASLAATMVAADGKVQPKEVETAIAIGLQLIEGFSAELFGEVLAGSSGLPGTRELASMLSGLMEQPAKVSVLKYLLAIAAADGNIADAEIAELEAAAEAMGISLPEMQQGAA